MRGLLARRRRSLQIRRARLIVPTRKREVQARESYGRHALSVYCTLVYLAPTGGVPWRARRFSPCRWSSGCLTRRRGSPRDWRAAGSGRVGGSDARLVQLCWPAATHGRGGGHPARCAAPASSTSPCMATAVMPSGWADVRVGQKPSRRSCLRSSAKYSTRTPDRPKMGQNESC
jgi:hypothetical protein